jgi:hypothetical protein
VLNRPEYPVTMTGREAGADQGAGADQPGRLAAALAAGARALTGDGDLQAGRQLFEQAYRLAEQAADVPAMAQAALGLAGLWVHESRTVTGAVLLESRLQRVLPLLDPASALALRVRIRLAGENDYLHGEHAAILAALEQARSSGDPVATADALSLAHHCVLGPDHGKLRRELAVELIKESFRTGRRSDLMMGLLWQTVDSYLAGDPHAGRLLAELRGQLADRNHLAVDFVVSAIDVMLAIRGGRLDEAESLASLCAKSGATAGDVDTEWWFGAQVLTIRWYQGRLAELLPMLRDLVHSPDLSAVDNSSLAALAVTAAHEGDRRLAASSLAALCGTDLARLPRSSSWLVTMNGVVEAAYLLDDADVAARAYELLSPYPDLPMIGSLGVTCFGSTQYALGVASLTTGHPDRAIAHLRGAVQHNLALGHWPAVVFSRQRLAQAYTLRGLPDDDAAARRELDTAIGEATAVGIPVPGGAAGRAQTAAECARAGRKWRVSLRDRAALVDHSIGMLHLAVLIANPRQEIQATDLVAGLAVLVSAAGLGEPARSSPDQGERARIAVGKAIRRALARIAEADPIIGAHLRQSVHTGVRCSYWPP